MPRNLTDTEKARFGRALAAELRLKRSMAKPDRWDLTTGSKTDLGLFETVARRITEAYALEDI